MKVIKLVPERVNFDQFWVEIRKRNRWLILLRYGAAMMLAVLILGIYLIGYFWLEFNVYTLPLWIITGLILLYNIILHKVWYANQELQYGVTKFHSLHFSLLQISLDLIALMFFIYYTGGAESPFYIFFIFHVIIGTMFLTGEVTSILFFLTLALTITGSVLEYNGVITHHGMNGMLPFPLYRNIPHLISFFTFNGIALFLAIYLANSVAKELYLRERDLTKAYHDLENAENSKSRYVQTIVHDLKTPIAASMTYLNMILDGTLGAIPEKHQHPLDRVKIRLTSAIQTINDILQITQLKLETKIENVSDIKIHEIFEEIYNELSILIISKNLEYKYHIDSLDITVQSEPKLLKLVLANLVSNAYKYTDIGGKIRINIQEQKENLTISVADNGIGIPEKEKQKIFQSFYRSSISKSKGIEGTGLGLSIVQEVIHKYHGTIEVYSPSYLAEGDERPGTQFVVTLPKKYSVI